MEVVESMKYNLEVYVYWMPNKASRISAKVHFNLTTPHTLKGSNTLVMLWKDPMHQRLCVLNLMKQSYLILCPYNWEISKDTILYVRTCAHTHKVTHTQPTYT